MAEALARLLHLRRSERHLIVEAAWLIFALRLAFRALPFRLLERVVHRLARRRTTPPTSTEHIAWAVATVGRRLPGTTCLLQALAAYVMLARRGTEAQVHIGVARDRGRPLESHAWVESEGRVVLGDTGLDRYVPMTEKLLARSP
jgi:hypothetical protein